MIVIPVAIFFSTNKNESTVPESQLVDQPTKIEGLALPITTGTVPLANRSWSIA
ncbi:MAG: hypothetical protein WBX25_32055 [Rhodomicrobium sp.]